MAEDGLGLLDGFGEVGEELLFVNEVAFGEFRRSIAIVGDFGQAGDDPLAEVASQVQKHVADAVHGVVGSAPNLVVVQLLEAVSDPVESASEFLSGGVSNRLA